jgi:hypothetical protein
MTGRTADASTVATAAVWPSSVMNSILKALPSGAHMNDRSHVTANQTLARHGSRQHDSIKLSNHRLNAYNDDAHFSLPGRELDRPLLPPAGSDGEVLERGLRLERICGLY